MNAAGTSGSSFVVDCDVHVVIDRVPDDWERLLGPDQLTLAKLIGLEGGEDLSIAATRVWRAAECLGRGGRHFVSSSHGAASPHRGRGAVAKLMLIFQSEVLPS